MSLLLPVNMAVNQVFAIVVMAVGAVIYSTLFGSMSALIAAVNIKESKSVTTAADTHDTSWHPLIYLLE